MDKIKTDRCDSCGVKASGVALHQYGCEVLFCCRQCMPKNYESTARREVDAWLAGGRIG